MAGRQTGKLQCDCGGGRDVRDTWTCGEGVKTGLCFWFRGGLDLWSGKIQMLMKLLEWDLSDIPEQVVSEPLFVELRILVVQK